MSCQLSCNLRLLLLPSPLPSAFTTVHTAPFTYLSISFPLTTIAPLTLTTPVPQLCHFSLSPLSPLYYAYHIISSFLPFVCSSLFICLSIHPLYLTPVSCSCIHNLVSSPPLLYYHFTSLSCLLLCYASL